jgi:predicted alpha-1,6-mannanase (GH76 family)
VKLTIATLMTHYEPDQGLWASEGWWNAANTTTAIADAASLAPSAEYSGVLQNTFVNAQKQFPLFRNKFYDDEGWWALAWIQAYDVTHRQPYLDMAESIFGDMRGGWDGTCQGGIWWNKDRHYKNAIANELFLSVAAHLAAREPAAKRPAYLAWAEREWNWFDHSGMINDDNLVNDGLTPDCKNNGRNTWSYNQGVLIGGLVELSSVTKDAGPLGRAKVIAHAAISKLTDEDQVLHDRTEPNCSHDVIQFKGILLRNLASLQGAAPEDTFARFIQANADSVWHKARTVGDEFACSWSGPARDNGAAGATSALDALVAAATLE